MADQILDTKDSRAIYRIAIDQQSHLKVDALRCTPIYDISTLAHDQTFRGVNMRLCGMKFQKLSDTKLSQLNRLLASISQKQ